MREGIGRQKIVGVAVRESGNRVRGRWSDEEQVGPVGEVDVIDGGGVAAPEHLEVDVVAG